LSPYGCLVASYMITFGNNILFGRSDVKFPVFFIKFYFWGFWCCFGKKCVCLCVIFGEEFSAIVRAAYLYQILQYQIAVFCRPNFQSWRRRLFFSTWAREFSYRGRCVSDVCVAVFRSFIFRPSTGLAALSICSRSAVYGRLRPSAYPYRNKDN